MALALPELQWQDVRVRRLQQHGGGQRHVRGARAVAQRRAGLPTALRQAQLVKIVQEDRIRALRLDSTRGGVLSRDVVLGGN
jgi:hypothetical protein